MRKRRSIGLAAFGAAAAALASTGCDTDIQGSLIDLTSSTTGSVVQIFLADWLTEQASQGNPDLEASLASHEH